MNNSPRGVRLKPHTVGVILLSVAVMALAVGVVIIDRLGDAVINARQIAVAESARDYFVAFANEEGSAPLARALGRRERDADPEAFRYAFFSNDGLLLGGANLLTWAQLPPPGWSRVKITSGGHTAYWQVLMQPVSSGGILLVYENLDERRSFRSALEAGALAALIISLSAVLLAASWLNRQLLRRAAAIEQTAGHIVSGQINSRAPANPDGDVFDRLGVSINAMLDHNEELMTGMRTVTDSLAHDLRSPLTRMKTALSRALDPLTPMGERDQAIGDALEEADLTLATTSALLDIARAETGVSRDMLRPVDISALLAEIVELFGPVLEDAGQTLIMIPAEGPAITNGHELLLRQAIGNLLHNASVHAGAGATVTVAVRSQGKRIQIIVADTGPGIPRKQRGRVLERFIRLDESRATPGSGLGLAIVAACAKLHNGVVGLENNDPGLRVVLDIGP